MSDLDFLPEELAEPTQQDGDFAPVAAGWYDVDIQRAEMKDTQAGGKMLSIGVVTDAGRWVWTNLNLVNQNEIAQKIAREEFAKLCRACGFAKRPAGLDVLIGKRVRAKVTIRTWNGEQRNDIKTWERSESAMPTGFGSSEQFDNATTGGKPAWMKG